MGFSRQEYRSGLPFPSPGDLPDPGIEPVPPALQIRNLPLEDSKERGTSWLCSIRSFRCGRPKGGKEAGSSAAIGHPPAPTPASTGRRRPRAAPSGCALARARAYLGLQFLPTGIPARGAGGNSRLWLAMVPRPPTRPPVVCVPRRSGR